MTMTEIRKELRMMKNYAKCKGYKELIAYYELMGKCFEKLYKNLTISEIPYEFMMVAIGYQIMTRNYKTLHIAQTHDLHTISCDSKSVARDFFQWWILN